MELTTLTGSGLAPLFANQTFAVAFGLALGVAFILFGRASSRFLTPEDAYLGLAKIAVAMVIRMVVAVAALMAYYFWAPTGLVPFGVALMAGFFLTITVELFTLTGSARAEQGGGR